MQTMYSYTVTGWFLLCSLSASSCNVQIITGFTGQNVTLPCRYDAGAHGLLYMCWGRGEIPHSGCTDPIINTNGEQVTSRKLDRYQLNGNLKAGDTSLTILSVSISDSGVYGCRIEVPGWFNDFKYSIQLNIKKQVSPNVTPNTPTSLSTTEFPAWTKTQSTQGDGNQETMGNTTFTSLHSDSLDRASFPVILVILVLLLLAAVVIFSVLLRERCRKAQRRHNTSVEVETVLYMNTEFSGEPSRAVAVENIYTLDVRNDYEYCR